jgi:hypothetical protein
MTRYYRDDPKWIIDIEQRSTRHGDEIRIAAGDYQRIKEVCELMAREWRGMAAVQYIWRKGKAKGKEAGV